MFLPVHFSLFPPCNPWCGYGFRAQRTVWFARGGGSKLVDLGPLFFALPRQLIGLDGGRTPLSEMLSGGSLTFSSYPRENEIFTSLQAVFLF